MSMVKAFLAFAGNVFQLYLAQSAYINTILNELRYLQCQQEMTEHTFSSNNHSSAELLEKSCFAQ